MTRETPRQYCTVAGRPCDCVEEMQCDSAEHIDTMELPRWAWITLLSVAVVVILIAGVVL